MKKLISVRNSSLYNNYHAWMDNINEILAKGNARVVNVTCGSESFDNATAWIEIDEGINPSSGIRR